ncbi:MAG: D-sedoheptulose-7-phosphate isomerase [Ignavibacteria bacterium]
MINKEKFTEESLRESGHTKILTISHCLTDIVKVADVLVKSIKTGRKIMLCGNGGSAADSQHIAAEFTIRLSHNVKRPAIPAIALTTNSSVLTAGGNDIGFENVFARIVEGLGVEGDVLVCISTSGNSENLIRAINVAKQKKIVTVGLLGETGGKMKDLCDYSICVPSQNVQRIQETHITIGHILCELVECDLYGK